MGRQISLKGWDGVEGTRDCFRQVRIMRKGGGKVNSLDLMPPLEQSRFLFFPVGRVVISNI